MSSAVFTTRCTALIASSIDSDSTSPVARIFSLNLPFRQTLAADYNPQRNTDQIVILEFDTGTFVAIIEQHLDPEFFELR